MSDTVILSIIYLSFPSIVFILFLPIILDEMKKIYLRKKYLGKRFRTKSTCLKQESNKWSNKIIMIKEVNYYRWNIYSFIANVVSDSGEILIEGDIFDSIELDDLDYEIKKEKNKKGKRNKMPRFFKFILYWLLILLVWKFVDNIEMIVLFIANKI